MTNHKQRENNALRLLVVDNHLLIREGLRFILANEPDLVLVGMASNGAEALLLLGEMEPDVVLMDIHMPDMDGLEVIGQIRERWPQVVVVILTTYGDDALMLKGLQTGATGYLLKDVDRATLLQTIRAAARGETLLSSATLTRLLTGAVSSSAPASKSQQLRGLALTKREQAVLEGVARGERNKEIAARLGISEPTVKTHLTNVYAKLSVDSRASAVVAAIEHGLLHLESGSKSRPRKSALLAQNTLLYTSER